MADSVWFVKGYNNLNLFLSNVTFLYTLKISEILTIFCLQGVEKCNRKKWSEVFKMHRKTPVSESPLIKLQTSRPATL